MQTSHTGDDIAAENANWRFDGDTVKSFEDHVSKSVPLYEEGHDLVLALSDFFVQKDSTVFEIGSSTGILSYKLAQRVASKGARVVGIDVIEDMVSYAQQKYQQPNLEFQCGDGLDIDMSGADLVVCYYVVQFVSPARRQLLIDKIYKSLRWGGALLMFEKVRACDARFQDIAAQLYMEYKLAQGYGPDEIVAKSRSLKSVLEPFSTQGNTDMLRRAGFEDVMSICKYICFEGFLAIK